MRPTGWFKYKLTLAASIFALICGCLPISSPAPHGNYYVTSEIAYLRDGPRYNSRVLGQLYKDDMVEKLQSTSAKWWRIRANRTGQVGWMQASILSLNPVKITCYYVTPDTVVLRECPGEECQSLQLLYRGDQVQRVEKNDRGWWRVLVIKGRGLGWLPEKDLVEHPVSPQSKIAKKNYYYVAVTYLKLYQQPMNSAKVIKTLKFNNQLQKLAENPLGWLKVRQPSSSAVGWVKQRYLESLPRRFPRGYQRHKRKLPKGQELEPEIM